MKSEEFGELFLVLIMSTGSIRMQVTPAHQEARVGAEEAVDVAAAVDATAVVVGVVTIQ